LRNLKKQKIKGTLQSFLNHKHISYGKQH